MLFSDPVASPVETLVADLRDYPEWHRGRERYGVWIVPVRDAALLDYIDTAREQLADLIHASPRRQPHLTVFVCGFHGDGERDDDFPPARLERQLSSLKAATGEPCTLPLAPPDSFASAAFIPVGDPLGRLAQWRKLLDATGLEIRQSPYVPHITLGLYQRCVTADILRQRLAALATPPPVLAVGELEYVTYTARDQLGPLHAMHCVPLGAASRLISPASP